MDGLILFLILKAATVGSLNLCTSISQLCLNLNLYIIAQKPLTITSFAQ